MSYDLESWPAQAPPADFAERTVSAMLQAEGASRSKRRRWIVPGALAAILLGSAAWAMRGSDSTPPPPAAPEVRPVAAAPAPPTAEPVVEVGPPAPEPEEEPAPARPPTPRRPAVAASAPPPEAQPDAGGLVMHPRCICEHGSSICSCVE